MCVCVCVLPRPTVRIGLASLPGWLTSRPGKQADKKLTVSRVEKEAYDVTSFSSQSDCEPALARDTFVLLLRPSVRAREQETSKEARPLLRREHVPLTASYWHVLCIQARP